MRNDFKINFSINYFKIKWRMEKYLEPCEDHELILNPDDLYYYQLCISIVNGEKTVVTGINLVERRIMYKYCGLKYVVWSVWFVLVLTWWLFELIYFGFFFTIAILVYDFNFKNYGKWWKEIHTENRRWLDPEVFPPSYSDNNPWETFIRYLEGPFSSKD